MHARHELLLTKGRNKAYNCGEKCPHLFTTMQVKDRQSNRHVNTMQMQAPDTTPVCLSCNMQRAKTNENRDRNHIRDNIAILLLLAS